MIILISFVLCKFGGRIKKFLCFLIYLTFDVACTVLTGQISIFVKRLFQNFSHRKKLNETMKNFLYYDCNSFCHLNYFFVLMSASVIF